jgi:hypothetical protein
MGLEVAISVEVAISAEVTLAAIMDGEAVVTAGTVVVTGGEVVMAGEAAVHMAAGSGWLVRPSLLVWGRPVLVRRISRLVVGLSLRLRRF